MLIEYPGNVTVKIDGVAASAASVIAMAGTKVYMSPVSMLMIHNPMTMAYGNTSEMQKAIDMLSEVKESIINAYEVKTGLSRAKLSRLMDAETWMNANKAVELGFADGVLNKVNDDSNALLEQPSLATSFSRVEVTNSLMNKIADKCRIEKKSVTKQEEPILTERSVDSLMDRLKLIKNHI